MHHVIAGPRLWFMPVQERPTHVKAVIGERLRVLRAALGVQQKDLAAFLNVTPQTVSGWESGRDLADPLAIARMALRWGVPTDWVWTGSLAHVPPPLAAKIEARRPDLVLGASGHTAPVDGWDKPEKLVAAG